MNSLQLAYLIVLWLARTESVNVFPSSVLISNADVPKGHTLSRNFAALSRLYVTIDHLGDRNNTDRITVKIGDAHEMTLNILISQIVPQLQNGLLSYKEIPAGQDLAITNNNADDNFVWYLYVVTSSPENDAVPVYDAGIAIDEVRRDLVNSGAVTLLFATNPYFFVIDKFGFSDNQPASTYAVYSCPYPEIHDDYLHIINGPDTQSTVYVLAPLATVAFSNMNNARASFSVHRGYMTTGQTLLGGESVSISSAGYMSPDGFKYATPFPNNAAFSFNMDVEVNFTFHVSVSAVGRDFITIGVGDLVQEYRNKFTGTVYGLGSTFLVNNGNPTSPDTRFHIVVETKSTGNPAGDSSSTTGSSTTALTTPTTTSHRELVSSFLPMIVLLILLVRQY